MQCQDGSVQSPGASRESSGSGQFGTHSGEECEPLSSGSGTPGAAEKLRETEPGRKPRRFSHSRSHTADAAVLSSSSRSLLEEAKEEAEDSSASSLALPWAATNCDENDGAGTLKIRRVLSEPRVIPGLDISKQGLAHLESGNFSELYLTSEDEDYVQGVEDKVFRSSNEENESADATLSPFTRRTKKFLKTSKRRRQPRKRPNNTAQVQVSYFQDENGDIRDEYGFKIEKSGVPQYLITPTLTEDHHAAVPSDAKRKILDREASRRKQKEIWEEIIRELGMPISDLPLGTLERWRKYLNRSPLGGDNADSYLRRISAPFSENQHLMRLRSFHEEERTSHEKKPSEGSDAASSQDSPKKSGNRFLSAVKKLRPRGNRKKQGKNNMTDDDTSFKELARCTARPGSIALEMLDVNTGGSANSGLSSPNTSITSFGSGSPIPRQAVRDASVPSSVLRQITHAIRTCGIPPSLRREVWLSCSGALSKQHGSAASDQYEHLVNLATRSSRRPEMAEIIERDLHRTFPTNYHFEDKEGIARMRRVLLAYSLRNRAIGYCQSMNFLVAVLLLHMEENLAFWALAAIVEDLVPGHYTKQMTGMHVDQRVFDSLVKLKLPKLYGHFEAIGFPLEAVTYQWFLCLFVNTLPLETSLRIWDCFVHEGTKALFRSGLGILVIFQKELLQCESFSEVYECLSLSEKPNRDEVLAADRVMRLAYDHSFFRSFPSSKISMLRSFHLPHVLDDLGKQGDWNDLRRQGRGDSVSSSSSKRQQEGESFKYYHVQGHRKIKASSSMPSPVEMEKIEIPKRHQRRNTLEADILLKREDDDEEEEDTILTQTTEESGVDAESSMQRESSLPKEFSQLLPTLKYVMSARQIDTQEQQEQKVKLEADEGNEDSKRPKFGLTSWKKKSKKKKTRKSL